MAQPLPRFVASTPITPGPLTSAAPSFEAMAQTFGGIQQVEQQKLQKVADQEALIKGEEAGTEPGFKVAKGQGEATLIFNKAALATNQQIMGRQISQHFSQMAQQSLQEFPDANQAMIAYKAGTQSYAQQLLSQTPEENKVFAQNLLRYHGLNGLSALQKKANAQAQLKLSAEYVETGAQAKNDAMAAIDKGNVKQGLVLIGQKWRNDELALLSKKITLGQFKSAQTQDRLDINKQTAIVGYKQALAQGKGLQYISSLQNKSFPGLNDEQKTNFIDFLSKVRDQQLQGMGMDKATIATQSKDELIAIRRGAAPNLKIRQGVSLSNPTHLEQYDKDVADAQQYFQATTGAISKPLIDQIPYVNQYRPPDPNVPDFARKLRNYDSMIKGVHDFQNKMFGKNADPIPLLKSHPGVVAALNQRANAEAAGVTGQQAPNVSINQKLLSNDEQMANAQIQGGRSPANVMMLSVDEARANVAEFKRAGAAGQIDQQVQQLQILRAQHPKFFSNVINDLARQGLPKNSQFLVDVPPNSPLLPEIEQSFTAKEKELTDNISSTSKSAIDKVLDDGSDSETENYIESFKGFKSTNTEQHIAAYKNYVRRIAYVLQSEDSSLSAQNAVARASSTVAGQFHYTTIDGQMQRIPLQYNPSAVKSYALQQEKNLKSFNFVLQDGSIGLPNRRQHEMQTVIKPGHWSPNSQNDGMIYTNVQGQPVHDPQGNMFQFKYADAVRNFAPDYGTFSYYARGAEQKLNSVVPAIKSVPQAHSLILAQETAKKIRAGVTFPDVLKSVNVTAKTLGLPPLTMGELQFESKLASKVKSAKDLKEATVIVSQLMNPSADPTLRGQELNGLLTNGS